MDDLDRTLIELWRRKTGEEIKPASPEVHDTAGLIHEQQAKSGRRSVAFMSDPSAVATLILAGGEIAKHRARIAELEPELEKLKGK